MPKDPALPTDDDEVAVDINGISLGDIDEPALDELVDEEEEDIDALNSGQYFDDVSDDSVRLYLREIGKIPLLNAEEELLLARRIKLSSLLEAALKRETAQQEAADAADAEDSHDR